jgi:DNA-binding NarL/FixJ family response regulator
MTHRPRVLLADDHVIVAEGVRGQLETEFDIAGVVFRGETLIVEAERLRPDVIVTDVAMPDLSGLEAIRQLRGRGFAGAIVVLTMYEDAKLCAEAIRAGAHAYVLKNGATRELVFAIREACAGRTYVPRELRDEVAAQLRAAKADSQPDLALSLRKRQILRLLYEGRTTKQIAAVLGISRRTVESHKYELMRTLRVGSTLELLRYAGRLGVVKPPAL